MDFSQALMKVKEGFKVSRQGWNGAGMWISLSPGKENCPAHELWGPQNRSFAIANGGTATVRPYITLKTAQGDIVPWVASQTDLLADDWMMA